MPKSKRDKEVSLTKVKKKGKAMKEKLVTDIRRCLDDYEHVFVFSVDNMRNNKLKDTRQHFKTDSRFFFGKNKVMGLALGRIPEEEYREGLHKVSKHLLGQCGLLCTNRDKDEVIQYFKGYAAADFARAGNEVSESISLPAGPLEHFVFSMEPQLRKLGMPTTLVKGEIHLLEDFTVCKAGHKLTPEQAKILKLLNMEMTKFRLHLLCVWSKKNSTFKSLVKKRRRKGGDAEMEAE